MGEEAGDTRKVVITGGSAGIGFSTADRLVHLGHSVFICARNRQTLNLAIEQIRDRHEGAHISGDVCDVRNYDDVVKFMAAADAWMGGIDVLVNNAGIASVKPFEDMSAEDWKDMVDINLTGVFNGCKAALPMLKQSTCANIINLGSRAGRYAFPGGTAYNATKFGLQGFSEALFLDISRYGIGVSLVAPGTVATDLSGSSEDWHLQAEDIAKVISDLLTNNNRANINWVEVRPGRPPSG